MRWLIRGGEDVPDVKGLVALYQEQGSVLVVANVTDLPQDSETCFFGFLIHEGDSCSGTGFPQTCNHYNPQ